MPSASLVRSSRSPISPVEQTATSNAPPPMSSATSSAAAWVVWKPSGPVQQLAPPELSTTPRRRGRRRATCCAPEHRRGLDPVAGEHGRRVVAGPVVDDEGHVGPAAGLEAGGGTGGAEAGGGGDAHGATPATGRPSVSGSPRARFAHCTAAPAVPLVRLSMAATTTTRPARCVHRDLHVRVVAAEHGRGATASAPRAAGGRTARRRTRRPGRPHVPDVGAGRQPRGRQVARIPRGIGASVGVKESGHRTARRERSGSARSPGCAGGRRRPRRRHGAHDLARRAGAA